MATIQKKHNIKAWLMCITAALYFFYAFAQFNLINSLTHSLMQAWQLTYSQLTLLSSSYLCAIALFFIPTGFWLDFYSTRKLLLLGMGISVIASVLFITADNFYFAVTMRFVLGAVHALGFLGSMRVATYWLPERKAFAIGVVISIGLLGGLVVQSPLALLITSVGWREAVLSFSLFGFFAWVLIFFVIEDVTVTTKEHLNFKNWLFDFRKIAMQSQNWLCAGYTCLLNLPIIILGALWGDNYLINNYQLTYLNASYVITALYLGMLLGSPVIGEISDKLNNRKTLMIITAIIAFALVSIIYFNIINNLYLLIILFFIMGFSISAQNLSYAVIAEINPINRISTAIGLMSIVIMGGGAVAQTIFTWIMHLSKVNIQPDVLNYREAFLILPASLLLSLILAFFINCNQKSASRCK